MKHLQQTTNNLLCTNIEMNHFQSLLFYRQLKFYNLPRGNFSVKKHFLILILFFSFQNKDIFTRENCHS